MILFLLPKRLKDHFKRYRFTANLIKLIFILVIIIAGFVISFKFIENASWGESWWQCWQTITTIGYGNAPAQKTWGRCITALFGTLGLAFLTAAITACFECYADRKTRRRLGLMKTPYPTGYVIFNMPLPCDTQTLIGELRATEEDVPITIVDNRIDELPSAISELPFVFFVRGNLLSADTYRRANVNDRKKVIVFPENPERSESDGVTQTVVSLINRLSPDTTVMHVLVDTNNSWLFDDLKSVCINQNIQMLTIVQECQGVHTANVIQRLLSNREGANPETVKPSLIIGWTWKDLLLATIMAAEETGIEVNFLAVIQGGIPHNCPPHNTVIGPDDYLCAIVHTPFDWQSLEKAIASRGLPVRV